MRTFRNPLSHWGALALLSTSVFSFYPCSFAEPVQPNVAGAEGEKAAGSPFFPMAIGNSWAYRCSVEGEHAFDKTLTVTSAEEIEGKRYFRTELKVGSDPTPLVSFVFTDDTGRVFSTTDPRAGTAELLVTRDPKIGDHIGSLTVTSKETVTTPALGTVEAFRVESFPFEEPGISEEEKMNWTGRFYARNVGLVAESDGLGGECLLVRIHLATP